jgi:thiamine transport system substrate-binding protein
MSAFRFVAAALLALAGLPATAQEAQTLRVYTYDSFASEWGPGPAIKTGFEKTCACTVEFVTSDDSIATLRKIQLEGATTTADVLLGLDTATSGEARATGLFAPHGLTIDGLALPRPWTDAEFVPFDYGYFAFVYNKETVATPPRSFEELIALPESFKIVIQDPRSSSPGFGLVLWIEAAYGERAPEIWAGLKPHVLTMTRGWSEAYGLFLDGEADMVLSYTTSPPYHVVAENDTRFAAAEFAEGHIAQIEVAGVLKSSTKQALGQQFLQYLMSPEAQAVIPTTNWMYPVIDIGDALPKAFTEEAQPAKVLPVDETAVTANSRTWIDAALAALQ